MKTQSRKIHAQHQDQRCRVRHRQTLQRSQAAVSDALGGRCRGEAPAGPIGHREDGQECLRTSSCASSCCCTQGRHHQALMELDLVYLPHEDRMRLSVRGKVDWLITRNLLLKLVDAWVKKLESVELPQVGVPLGDRDVGQEHALSLEFDAPVTTEHKPVTAAQAKLLQEVTLTVDTVSTQLVLKGQELQTTLKLTRKESHMVLELLAGKARAVRWVNAVVWPQWLGAA